MTTVNPGNTLNLTPTTSPEQNLKVTNGHNTAGSFSLKSPNVNEVPKSINAYDVLNYVIPIGTTIFTNTGNVSLDATTG